MPRNVAKPTDALGIDSFDEVPWSAARETCPFADEVDDGPEPTSVRIYRGDVVATSIAWAAEPATNVIIIVEGTLWVDGLLDLHANGFEDESALLLYVAKDVSAGDVAARIDSVLLVGGAIEAERLLICGGEGSVARIEATRLSAALVLESNAHVGADTSTARFWGNESNIELPGGQFVDEPGELLRPELLDDGKPSLERIVAALRAGKPTLI